MGLKAAGSEKVPVLDRLNLILIIEFLYAFEMACDNIKCVKELLKVVPLSYKKVGVRITNGSAILRIKFRALFHRNRSGEDVFPGDK